MKLLSISLALMIATIVSAQTPGSSLPVPIDLPQPTPVLTEVQRLTMQNKVLSAERAALASSPDALAKAIAELIATRQRTAQQTEAEMNAYYNGLSVEGFTLNPQTWVYERLPKK